MEKWLCNRFQSGSRTTREFDLFARQFKAFIKKSLPEDADLVGFNKGHFYLSGFIKKQDRYVYFSTSDVRYFQDAWYNNVLVRTAKHDKDFSGGCNNYTKLPAFRSAIDSLLNVNIAA